MIEYPLTGVRLIALNQVRFGKKVIKKNQVIEIEKVMFIDESMDIERLCGVAFTIKGFPKAVSFPVETPHFEELEDLDNEQILNWNN